MESFTLLRPLLHRLPPEAVHGLGLFALKNGLIPAAPSFDDPLLHIETMGLRFTNPLGLAAGFDKNAAAVDALLAQGFGFVEAGTTTPRPQPGNPRPRVFRLREDEAVINRLGFNNEGHAVFVKNFRRRDPRKGIAGVNIGKNKDSTDAVADYTTGIAVMYPHADYITVNIPSPNTQGLRDLQQRDALEALLAALMQTRADCTCASGRQVPLLLKVAPDLDMQQKKDIATLVLAHKLDGLIVSNTTVARSAGLRSAQLNEQGGLSGRPLFAASTEALADFYRLTGGALPLVGVGGIASAEDAYRKIRSGATLLQLYTALVYQGFGAVRRIQRGLVELLRRDGFTSLRQAVGADIR